jgi:hypothetical protein
MNRSSHSSVQIPARLDSEAHTRSAESQGIDRCHKGAGRTFLARLRVVGGLTRREGKVANLVRGADNQVLSLFGTHESLAHIAPGSGAVGRRFRAFRLYGCARRPWQRFQREHRPGRGTGRVSGRRRDWGRQQQ